MDEISAKKIIVGVLALMPMVLSLAWLISLLMNSTTIAFDSEGFMLSPIQNKWPIVTSLVMFMAGYSLFLLFVFSSNLRKALARVIGKK